jgi:hypothetical protein
MIAHVTSTIIGCARAGTNLDTTRYRSPSGRPPWQARCRNRAKLRVRYLTKLSVKVSLCQAGAETETPFHSQKGGILAGSPACSESRRGLLQESSAVSCQLSAITRSDQRCAASRRNSLRCSAASLPGSNGRQAAERRAGCRRCIAWQRSLSWTCRRVVHTRWLLRQ